MTTHPPSAAPPLPQDGADPPPTPVTPSDAAEALSTPLAPSGTPSPGGQAPPPPCTCTLKGRPDVGEISAALLVEPLSRISKRLGISKSTLHKHRVRCLGHAGPPPIVAAALQQVGLLFPERAPRTAPEPLENEGGTNVPDEGPDLDRADGLARVEEEAPLTGKRMEAAIRHIAGVVAAGEWTGWVTANGLARKLNLPVEEVLRLHQLAAGKVSEARGTQRAQRESSIAATRRMRDEELAAARRYDKEAVDSHAAAKVDPDRKASVASYLHAKQSRRLAASHRRSALDCQKHLDAITIMKPPQITVNVNYRGSPDFQIAWRAMGEAADALWGPGSSAKLEQALGVLEDDGPQGFEAWLAEHRVVVVESPQEPPPSPEPPPPAPISEAAE